MRCSPPCNSAPRAGWRWIHSGTLHGLSLRFHLDRQTGGVSRAVERGVAGIQQVLRLAVFNLLPTLFEVLLVTGTIWYLFDWRYAAVTFGAVASYIGFTVAFTSWRVKYRRQMNEVDSEANTKALDSLLNYETVKYFGNEAHEADRYDNALARYETAAVRTQVTLNMLNIGQAFIIAAGLALIMLMAGRGVAAGSMTVGKFVLVNTYLMQLYQPLNFLGFVYASIRQGVVDMEQMFRLLAVDQEVADTPQSNPLSPVHASDGLAAVAFNDVHFGYRPDREILHGVSFTVPPGAKLAIVGATGAGKSTISRLLFRFYDVSDGQVLVDGRDIRKVTQRSLRAAIGVVPQDTVLFNDTIRYNIAYGRVGATQAEVEHAARQAQVHDFVLRLPDGYDTIVGERGLKLSGGEKQRVAIARTILKDPRILILDEATSALDTRDGARDRHRAAECRSQPNHDRHRASPVHGDRRKRDHRAVRGPDHRARHPCLAPRLPWRIHGHVAVAGRGGAGGMGCRSAGCGACFSRRANFTGLNTRRLRPFTGVEGDSR